MLFYITSMVFASMIMLFPNKKKIKLNKGNIRICPAFFSFLIIGLLIGLRDGIGLDDVTFLRTFNEAATLGYATRNIETSFMLVCKIVIVIGGNYHLVILLYALLGCSLIGRVMNEFIIKKEQVLVFIIFWAFFFPDLFTAFRQLLAIGLLLNSYLEYRKRKIFKAIIWLIFAVFIHKTAIVGIFYLLLVPYVKKMKTSVKIYILLICYIIQYIPFVSLILNFINHIRFLKQFYYVRFFLTEGATNLFSDPLGIIATIMLIMSIGIMLKYRKNQNNPIQLTGILNYEELEAYNFLYWSSLMILNQFGFIRRLTYYIGFFMAAYLVRSIGLFSKGSKLQAKILVYVFSLAVFSYILMNYKVRGSLSPALIPYKITFDLFG